jgi:PAS domain S-box-containing protein
MDNSTRKISLEESPAPTAASLQERIRLISDALPALISYVDTERRYQFCNRAYSEWFQLPEEKILGHSMREVLGEKAWQTIAPHVDEAFAGQVVEYEAYTHYQTGPRWIHASYMPHRDSQGRVVGIMVMVTDVTQQKRAERLIDSQKHSLEMVVGGAPLSEVLTYLARVVEEQSDGRATASILLLDSDGLLRNGASPSLPADYLQAIDGLEPCATIGTCAAAAATGQVIITSDIDADPNWQTLKHLPLGLGFVAAWSQPINASDGRVLGTFGTYFRECREPTSFERQTVEILARTAALAIERRRVEDERKRFVSLAENSSDFIGMCDANLVPFFVNRAGLAMVGLENLAQARRTPVKEFFFPEDQQRVINEFFPKVLAEGHGEIEIRFRHFKTGATLWMLYNVWVVTDDCGVFAGLATVSRNITDRKRVEDALRVSRAELASANEQLASRAQQLDALVEERTAELRETIQQLETFSYSIVHDMRAPLRSMRSFAGFLLDDHAAHLDPTAVDYLRRIMESSARMDALITDVLAYSRVSRSRSDLTTVNLDLLLPEIIEQYPNLQEKSQWIRLRRPLPKVAGNTALLTQVFSNLLSNALKFVTDGREPQVKVFAETHPDRVRLWVEDNGIGVPPDQRERIFGLFQRLHRPIEYAGTGVGLAIVKRAMERMGGNAGVESECGIGSRFWIDLLPAEDVAEAESRLEAEGRRL